jgi:polyphosphate glucokinase
MKKRRAISDKPATPHNGADSLPNVNRILAVDVGGTKLKILATGATEPRKAASGPDFTPAKMVETVRELAHGWHFDAVSIGIPALVGHHGPKSEPGNLGSGWVGFDYAAAFERPVKIINDAAMQALGSYDGGRMLFLGLGTGVGAALIAENAIVPMELGHLMWKDNRLGLFEVLGREGLRRFGLRTWRRAVATTVRRLMHAFIVDYVVVGGGNAKRLDELPHGVRRGHNLTAFRGGLHLWGVEDVPALVAGAPATAPAPHVALDWRLL